MYSIFNTIELVEFDGILIAKGFFLNDLYKESSLGLNF